MKAKRTNDGEIAQNKNVKPVDNKPNPKTFRNETKPNARAHTHTYTHRETETKNTNTHTRSHRRSDRSQAKPSTQ